MQIEYVATKSKRTVPDAIGEALIARKIARRIETRELKAEAPEVDHVSAAHDQAVGAGEDAFVHVEREAIVDGREIQAAVDHFNGLADENLRIC